MDNEIVHDACSYCSKFELFGEPPEDWIYWSHAEKTSCPDCFLKGKDEELRVINYKIKNKTNKKPKNPDCGATLEDLVRRTKMTVKEFEKRKISAVKMLSEITEIGFEYIKSSTKGSDFYE